ncbi:pirin family protein [Rhodococcus aerolatus]
MSNLEASPDSHAAGPGTTTLATRLVPPREVPLGGPRAMTVRRTLPSRGLSTVGAWCFLDDYGPDDVGASGGMHVPPHPHTGLQTVSWLLDGAIHHRDSVGGDLVVRPGELGLMTSGAGIAHSEHTPDDAPAGLRGVQLWVALPEPARTVDARIEHHPDLPGGEQDGVRTVVIAGELAGARSPARVHSGLLGAELRLAPGARTVLPLDPDFEHGLLVLNGGLTAEGTDLAAGPLLDLGRGRRALSLSSEAGATVLLLGGEPYTDPLVMWWNFVGGSHEEVVAARADWASEDDSTGSARFGTVPGGEARLPAPALPHVRLHPRT